MVAPLLNTYELSWKPNREQLVKPFYRSLADLIEQDIRKGILAPYTKLPPQRELARYLEVNLSTVTKAYHLCEKQGLINAVVGRGSFVSPTAAQKPFVPHLNDSSLINMGTLTPSWIHAKLIRQAGLRVLKNPDSASLFDYEHHLGSEKQIEAGVTWLLELGVAVSPDDLLITMGTSHAYTVVLASLFEEGNALAVSQYTNPSFVAAASLLGMKLVPIENDSEGINIRKLAAACKVSNIKALYILPNGDPTNTVMSENRRIELARLAQQHNFFIIEDDAFLPLFERKPVPLYNYDSDHVIYISGLSLPIGGGLKLAYLAVPSSLKKVISQGIFASIFKLPPFDLAVATDLIDRGIHRRILDEKREMARFRNSAFSALFPACPLGRESLAQWLVLPEGFRAKTCADLLLEKGVRVFPSSHFAVGEGAADNALFVATCSPKTIEEFYRGAYAIKDVLLSDDGHLSNC